MFTPDKEVQSLAVKFAAADGYCLGGTLHYRPGDENPPTVVVFSTGCGMRAHRYRHFGMYLATRGIPTFMYDFRGIGQSRPAKLRDLDTGFEDWAELDCAAAITFLRQRFPSSQMAGVAHSIGCLIMVAAPNSHLVTQYVMICPHTGYFRDYEMPWRPLMWIYYHQIMILLAKCFGYFPASSLRTGDDLPKGVALQWATRTTSAIAANTNGWDAARIHRILANIKEARGTTLIVSATDDTFASESGVRRFLFAAPALFSVRRSLTPQRFPIGHWGFFRRRSSDTLWPIVDSFFASH